MGINHDMSLLLFLLTDIFTLLNAELNNKWLMKCTHLKGPMLPSLRSKVKEAKKNLICRKNLERFGTSPVN
jgi:hypothetical protein